MKQLVIRVYTVVGKSLNEKELKALEGKDLKNAGRQLAKLVGETVSNDIPEADVVSHVDVDIEDVEYEDTDKPEGEEHD